MGDRHFHSKLSQLMQRIPSLNSIQQKSFSLLKIIIIILTISFVIEATIWIFDRDDSISVQPFETVGIGENLDEKPLATFLSSDLQRIKNIYGPGLKSMNQKSNSGSLIIQKPLNDLYVSSISSEKNPLPYSLSQIGTIGAEGTSISIGNLLLSMKEFLGNKPSTITCSLQKYNSTVFLVAILEDHSSSKNGDVLIFEDKADMADNEQIPSLINDLAFNISLELSKRRDQSKGDYKYPRTIQTFKYLTEGRDAYNSYVSTRDSKDLARGLEMASLANEFEPEYGGAYELLNALGFAYLEKGNYTEATNIFQNITVFKPYESELGLGMVSFQKNNFSKALEHIDLAIQLNPQNPNAWNYRGVILCSLRQYGEAIKAFDNAIMLNSQFAEAWKNKGMALMNKNDSHNASDALICFDQAIKLNPKYAEAWYYKGRALFNLNCPKDALQAYERVIELDPKNARAWYECYIALNRSNESYKAGLYRQKSLDIAKKWLEAHPNKGASQNRR
jgi:tetratricopeptide (TPR) repeat protein